MNKLPKELQNIIQEYRTGYVIIYIRHGRTHTLTMKNNIINIPDDIRHLCTKIYSINTLYITEPGAFSDCIALRKIDIEGLDITQVNDLSDTFNGCRSLMGIDKLISRWNVGHIIDFKRAFRNTRKLPDTLDLSKWDVYNCYNMSTMFYGSNLSTQSKNLIKNNWQVKPSTGTYRMFPFNNL
jgi:hypothetical protein